MGEYNAPKFRVNLNGVTVVRALWSAFKDKNILTFVYEILGCSKLVSQLQDILKSDNADFNSSHLFKQRRSDSRGFLPYPGQELSDYFHLSWLPYKQFQSDSRGFLSYRGQDFSGNFGLSWLLNKQLQSDSRGFLPYRGQEFSYYFYPSRLLNKQFQSDSRDFQTSREQEHSKYLQPLPSRLLNEQNQSHPRVFLRYPEQEFTNDVQRSRLLNVQDQSLFRNFLPNQREKFKFDPQQSQSLFTALLRHLLQELIDGPQNSPQPPFNDIPASSQEQHLSNLGSGEWSSPSSSHGSFRDDGYSKTLSTSDSDSNSDVPSLPESSTDMDNPNPLLGLTATKAWFEDKMILLQDELRQYQDEPNIQNRKQLQQLAESAAEVQNWFKVAKEEILAIERSITTFSQNLLQEMQQILIENQDGLM